MGRHIETRIFGHTVRREALERPSRKDLTSHNWSWRIGRARVPQRVELVVTDSAVYLEAYNQEQDHPDRPGWVRFVDEKAGAEVVQTFIILGRIVAETVIVCDQGYKPEKVD